MCGCEKDKETNAIIFIKTHNGGNRYTQIILGSDLRQVESLYFSFFDENDSKDTVGVIQPRRKFLISDSAFHFIKSYIENINFIVTPNKYGLIEDYYTILLNFNDNMSNCDTIILSTKERGISFFKDINNYLQNSPYKQELRDLSNVISVSFIDDYSMQPTEYQKKIVDSLDKIENQSEH
jgi:hypothetical protein